MRPALSLAVILFAVGVLLAMPSPLPSGIGAVDFRPFWSASFLFIRGEDFTDPAQLFQVQRELTDWRTNYPMLVWNPPWLFLILAPFTLIAFSRAVWWWTLTNLALTSIAAIVIWQCTSQQQTTKKKSWIGLLLVFAFSMTLVTFTEGQVDSLLLLGIAGFLYFTRTRHEALAGSSLMLITIKPQLIYITLPVLILHLIYTRRWRAIFGFLTTLAILAIASFAIRPTWINDFFFAFGRGPVLDWEVPTLGGALAVAFGWAWAKWIGVVILPLAIGAWFYWRKKWDWRTLLDASLLLGILTTPFVWSYDQILLLIPMMRVVVWIIEGAIDPWTGRLIVFLLILIDVVTFYERVITPGELYFFWVPILFAAIYAYAWRRAQKSLVYA